MHGGAGGVPLPEQAERQAAVDRALEAGWSELGAGALAAVIAAVRLMEDEPMLNAGIGACLNRDGEIEHDAGVMEGTHLRAGAVAAVRTVRHPIDLARAVMENGRHVLVVGVGAARFAEEHGVETCDPSLFLTDRQRQRWSEGSDTVGAVARDAEGRIAVAVSTGGYSGKLPGRVGDSPIIGAGFYADDHWGGVCCTGKGEAFMRLVLAHHVIVELAHGMSVEAVAQGAIGHLETVDGIGGLIMLDAAGRPAAVFNTPFMPWAARTDGDSNALH